MECNLRQGSDACDSLCDDGRCPGGDVCVSVKFREGVDDPKFPRRALDVIAANAPGTKKVQEKKAKTEEAERHPKNP